jgi:hypothetical protein
MLQAPSSVNVPARPTLTHSPGPKGLAPAPGPGDIGPHADATGGSHADMEAGVNLIRQSLPNTSDVSGVGGRFDATA